MGEQMKKSTPEPNQEILLIENEAEEESTDFETPERGQNSRGWEKWWWKKPHKLCNRCSRDCKQSARAKIIRCPQYLNKVVDFVRKNVVQ